MVSMRKLTGNFGDEPYNYWFFEYTPTQRSKRLSSLKGGPVFSSSFICENNGLTSLKYAPKKVKRYFSCACNCLSSLEFGPEYAKTYNCFFNNLTSLKHCPTYVKELRCHLNPELTDISDIPPMCEVVCIGGCHKIDKFPSKIATTLKFQGVEPEVRERIKAFPPYEIVQERGRTIIVRNKPIGQQLLDSL